MGKMPRVKVTKTPLKQVKQAEVVKKAFQLSKNQVKRKKQISIEEAVNISFDEHRIKRKKSRKSSNIKIDPLQKICKKKKRKKSKRKKEKNRKEKKEEIGKKKKKNKKKAAQNQKEKQSEIKKKSRTKSKRKAESKFKKK